MFELSAHLLMFLQIAAPIPVRTATSPLIRHTSSIHDMAPSEDGRSVTTLSEDNTLRTWNLETGVETSRVNLPKSTKTAQFFGGKRVLLWRKNDLLVWDAGKPDAEMPVIASELHPLSQFDIVDHGARLLTFDLKGVSDHRENAKLYDLRDGKEIKDFANLFLAPNIETPRRKKREDIVSILHAAKDRRAVATIGIPEPVGGLGIKARLALRCRLLGEAPLACWQTKESDLCDLRFPPILAVSFTPDDRAILVYGCNGNQQSWVSFLESATGKERCRFTFDNWVYHRLVYAFSNDGSLLAVRTANTKATVFDIRRALRVATLEIDKGKIQCLAFVPKSSSLLAASSDGTVTAWNLRDQLAEARKVKSVLDLDCDLLWTEVGHEDPDVAFLAMRMMIRTGDQAAELLAQHLKPPERVTEAKLASLVSDLDHPSFARRTSAIDLLKKLGVQARPALEKSLKSPQSLEAQRRAKDLLDELQRRETAPTLADLRESRAVEMLEAIGTAKARSVLQSLAKGGPGSPLTAAAAAALQRLGR